MARVALFIFVNCCLFSLFLYIFLIVWIDIFSYFLPLGLFISSILFFVIFYFHIPAPEANALQDILGPEITVVNNNTTATSKNSKILRVIGHRGCGLDAPENSMAAVKKMAADQCLAVEFDVCLTADHVPIVFHDSTFSRMTEHGGKVSETLYEEIRNFDISLKHPFGRKFRNEHIPSLPEMVKTCLELNVKMFIDLKGDDPSIVEVILKEFKECLDLYEMAIVTSFNPILIYQIRSQDPKIVCSLAWRPCFYTHESYSGSTGGSFPRYSNPLMMWAFSLCDVIHKWALWNLLYYLLGLSVVLLHKDIITREVVSYWNKRNIRVIAWTVNLPSEKQFFQKNLKITYMTDTLINS